jgi:hypothetical protein
MREKRWEEMGIKSQNAIHGNVNVNGIGTDEPWAMDFS